MEVAKLEQIDSTHVLCRGRTFVYFGGCDYLRMSWHSAVRRAAIQGINSAGLNVAASRMTTGNHPVYDQLERRLKAFFRAPSATLVSNGYLTNLAVLQGLGSDLGLILIDENAHGSLRDAAMLAGTKVESFAHCNVGDLAKRIARHRNEAIMVMTDGVFAATGRLAPLGEYQRVIPNAGWLLVDDAHGVGVLGKTGRGSLEHWKLKRGRVIQTLTLSKALGVYGGVIVGASSIRRRIVANSSIFSGNTPLPPPLVLAAMRAVEVVDGSPAIRERLWSNVRFFENELSVGISNPVKLVFPVWSVAPSMSSRTKTLQRKLLAADIHPPFIRYPGGPENGFFRFAICSRHSRTQLRQLAAVLRDARVLN